MRRIVGTFTAVVAVAALTFNQPADAAFYGIPRFLKQHVERVVLGLPARAPMAHTRFCLQYPEECKVRRMTFRGGPVKLTPARWAELNSVNLTVNREIRPEPNLGGVATERWTIAPSAGDCNDYAVTKRHALLNLGWPARALLLAEVVVPSGEHHLVLVVRTSEGDLVADNLNANIRPWTAPRYRWVRVQSSRNPLFWSTLARADS